MHPSLLITGISESRFFFGFDESLVILKSANQLWFLNWKNKGKNSNLSDPLQWFALWLAQGQNWVESLRYADVKLEELHKMLANALNAYKSRVASMHVWTKYCRRCEPNDHWGAASIATVCSTGGSNHSCRYSQDRPARGRGVLWLRSRERRCHRGLHLVAEGRGKPDNNQRGKIFSQGKTKRKYFLKSLIRLDSIRLYFKLQNKAGNWMSLYTWNRLQFQYVRNWNFPGWQDKRGRGVEPADGERHWLGGRGGLHLSGQGWGRGKDWEEQSLDCSASQTSECCQTGRRGECHRVNGTQLSVWGIRYLFVSFFVAHPYFHPSILSIG